MTTWSAEDLIRDEAIQPLLLKHREAALREISREREPARLRLVEKIQEALEKDQK